MPSTFEESSVGDDLTRYANESFAIVLPNAYQLLPVTSSDDLTEALNRIEPNLLSGWVADVRRSIGDGMVLAAVDTTAFDSDTKDAPLVWVTRVDIREGVALDDIARTYENSLREAAGIDERIARREVALGSQQAALIEYSYRADHGQAEPLPTSARTYLFLKDTQLYLVQMTRATDRIEDQDALFRDIATSFEFIE